MSTNETRNPADPNPESQRFLFETCFDSDRSAGGSPDDEPEPVFSAEDLQNAREAAYAEGEAAGRQDAVNSLEKQILNGLGRLVEQMGALTDDQMRFQQDLTERSVELALKATRKMFPALAQRDGLVEIDALLTNCLLEAKEEPRITVRVATDLAEPYRERIDALAAAAGYQGVVTVLPDDGFGPADCRVEWSYGGAERVAAQMWREFDAATQRIFSDPVDEEEDDPGPDADREPPASTDGTVAPAPGADPAPEIPDALPGSPEGHAEDSVPATAELIGETAATPDAPQNHDPTDEPGGAATELSSPSDDAAAGTGTKPPADMPPHPATAS